MSGYCEVTVRENTTGQIADLDSGPEANLDVGPEPCPERVRLNNADDIVPSKFTEPTPSRPTCDGPGLVGRLSTNDERYLETSK